MLASAVSRRAGPVAGDWRGVPLQREVAAAPTAAAGAPAAKHVDAAMLDNLQFADEIDRAERWLASHPASSGERLRREAELARLNEERERRVRSGHVWLLEGRRPQALYQLVAGGEQVFVAQVDPSRAASAPACFSAGVLVSEGQFASILRQQSIETVQQPDAGTSAEGLMSAGAVGTSPSLTPWARAAAGEFSQPFKNARAVKSGLTGALGEASVATRTRIGGYGLLPIVDLNRVSKGFEVFDFNSKLTKQLISAKASAQATQTARVSYALSKGGGDVTLSDPSRQALFERAAKKIYPNQTPAAAKDLALERARLAVNPDDVAETARRLGGRLAADPAQFTSEIDRQLGRRPAQLEPGGTRFATLAAIDAEVAAKPHLRPAYQALVAEWARGAGGKVISHGTPSVELERIRDLRIGIGPATAEPLIRNAVSPEYLQTAARGGGVRGSLAAAGAPATYGAGAGGLIALAFSGWVYVVDHEGNVYDVVEQTSLGGASGAVAGATEQLATGAANRLLLGAAGAPGAIAAGTAGRSAIFARGLGGAAAGGVAAPVFVVGHMAYEEYTGKATYEAHKYVSKAGRAGVAGVVSGAAGTAAVGLLATVVPAAAAGTAAGPIGTVVGIIVGVGVYYLVDRAVGNEIESGLDRLAGSSSRRP